MNIPSESPEQPLTKLTSEKKKPSDPKEFFARLYEPDKPRTCPPPILEPSVPVQTPAPLPNFPFLSPPLFNPGHTAPPGMDLLQLQRHQLPGGFVSYCKYQCN